MSRRLSRSARRKLLIIGNLKGPAVAPGLFIFNILLNLKSVKMTDFKSDILSDFKPEIISGRALRNAGRGGRQLAPGGNSRPLSLIDPRCSAALRIAH